jgi:drug/metabolite transporter (DMT)-like permease
MSNLGGMNAASGDPGENHHHTLRFKTVLMIFLVVVFSPIGNTLLAKGMRNAGPLPFDTFANATHSVFAIFTSPYIWLGIAALMGFFGAYTLVLSWADYSFVQPAAAMAYGVTAILGHFALHEPVTPMRWLGVIVICLGVFVVGRTPPRTTDHR